MVNGPVEYKPDPCEVARTRLSTKCDKEMYVLNRESLDG